jgi:hypothetical protein
MRLAWTQAVVAIMVSLAGCDRRPSSEAGEASSTTSLQSSGAGADKQAPSLERCPVPSDLDPPGCPWVPHVRLSPDADMISLWPLSGASRPWAGWCHQPSSVGGIPERLWLPPHLTEADLPEGTGGRPRHLPWRTRSEYEAGALYEPVAPRSYLGECNWWAASTEPRPDDLLIVMARQEVFDYGMNVYRDGRVVFQSIRCPDRATTRVRKIEAAQVESLVAAFRRANFKDHVGCYGLATDVGSTLLAFYDAHESRVVSLCGLDSTSQPVAPLADLLEETVAGGTWVQ